MANTTKKTKTKKSNANGVRGRSAVQKVQRSPYFMGSIVVIILLASIVLGSWAIRTTVQATTQARLDRIEAIYADLQLDQDQYRVLETKVFGDKREYKNDPTRTHSSYIRYVYGDTVDNAVQHFDEKIRSNGFTFLEEPYPGITTKEYHYKAESGEYLRLVVASKVYEDARFNAEVLNESIPATIDQSAVMSQAPAVVTIRVNLDDNNE